MSALTGITVLDGDASSIPSDLLAAHVRHARRGNRLVILDRGDAIAKRFFAKGDTHIDLALGNYDFQADHGSRDDCEAAARAMLPALMCDPVQLAARPILADTLFSHGWLDNAADALRTLGHSEARSRLRNIPGDESAAATLTWSVLKVLRELADDLIVAPDHCRFMSVRRWLDLEADSVLFVSRYGSYNVLARALHARLTGRTLHWHSVGEMLFLEHADGLDDDARHQLALPLPENPNLTLTIDFDGIGVDEAPTSRPPAEIVAFARSGTAQDDDRPHDEEQAEAIRETEPAGPVDTSLDDELFASPRRARELAALPAPGGDEALRALTERIAALEARPTYYPVDETPAGLDADHGDRRHRRIQRGFIVAGVAAIAGLGWIVFDEPTNSPERLRLETEWMAKAEDRLSAIDDAAITPGIERQDMQRQTWQTAPASEPGGATGAANAATPGG
ncbi:hypothetical protein [Sphingomonas zeae]|uniref:Uncharacterized protein n=1 Tax=Sphingomonas zeae TaxID=1646122 RepID=A0A7Y6B5N0_9SPHN|nr:hypothetical protein [Sphingomonas zeae]MBB4048706.1 hypothetical protein [Sphingomonas zeae]NUU47864.1 hypothetical protein [Sphingomonas zeae]